MGASSGGVSWATSTCGGWYVWTMLLADARLSALALDGVPGLLGAGELGDTVSSGGRGLRDGVCWSCGGLENRVGEFGPESALGEDQAVIKLRTVVEGSVRALVEGAGRIEEGGGETRHTSGPGHLCEWNPKRRTKNVPVLWASSGFLGCAIARSQPACLRMGRAVERVVVRFGARRGWKVLSQWNKRRRREERREDCVFWFVRQRQRRQPAQQRCVGGDRRQISAAMTFSMSLLSDLSPDTCELSGERVGVGGRSGCPCGMMCGGGGGGGVVIFCCYSIPCCMSG